MLRHKSQHFLTINNMRLHIVKKLGAGNHGMVFLANTRDKNYQICVKRETSKERAQTEVDAIHAVYGHRTEVKKIDNFYYFTMPYFDGSNLLDLRKKGLSLYQKIIIAEKLCASLKKMHQAGVLHRDIKSNNIMVTRSPRGELDVHIIDFGRSVKLEEKQKLSLKTHLFRLFFQNQVAPEYLNKSEIGKHSDVYSFGVIFSKLFPDQKSISSLLMDKKKEARMISFEGFSNHLSHLFQREQKVLVNKLDQTLNYLKKSHNPQNAPLQEYIEDLKEKVCAAHYSDLKSIQAVHDSYAVYNENLAHLTTPGSRVTEYLSKFKQLFNQFIAKFGVQWESPKVSEAANNTGNSLNLGRRI